MTDTEMKKKRDLILHLEGKLVTSHQNEHLDLACFRKTLCELSPLPKPANASDLDNDYWWKLGHELGQSIC